MGKKESKKPTKRAHSDTVVKRSSNAMPRVFPWQHWDEWREVCFSCDNSGDIVNNIDNLVIISMLY